MGSLFDGIGGFPLAAIHNGIVPLWASEDVYKRQVYSIVRAVAEYMYQMERAPILKVDGLEDSYKVLADFNSVVLAGCPSKYGTQFVTWDRDFDHKGVSWL